jgi:8-oxo-dGTP pyrophosphatase MutT (NUDIX family)
VSSAVLIPILYKDNHINILFTKRSNMVKYHKGEISFPGGAIDKKDNNLLECVLRESYEEIGIEKKDVELIGVLDDILTVKTHFVITPFIGVIPYPYLFIANEAEIEEIIIAPIPVLTKEPNYEQKSLIDINDSHNLIHFFYYKEHTIWGATALILKQFLELFFDFKPSLASNKHNNKKLT